MARWIKLHGANNTCDQVYMSERNLRRIERGETPLTVESAVRRADFFHVGLNYLILGETDSNTVAKTENLTLSCLFGSLRKNRVISTATASCLFEIKRETIINV